MKPTIFNRFWLMLIVLALAALACSGGQTPVEPTTPNNNNNPTTDTGSGLTQSERATLIGATVQIYGLFNDNGQLTPRYVGSGTMLNSSGMILTNAHVASPASQGEPDMEPDALGIAITESEDKPPVASYIAKVLAVDGFLDLAVIQINTTVDGSSVDVNSLNFPFVELGDSNQVHVGDHVNIFGYPTIGGTTITFTQGSISGFTFEEQLGDRAWIKTDATIAGGNSGGLAADDNARIIGVPTRASSGGNGDITDCRQVQDTNGDGQVDKNDSCIPIGGFINALRPIELARPLIQAALAGKQYVSQFNAPGTVTQAGSGGEAVGNFSWAEATYQSDGSCKLGNAVSSFPSSILCIGTVMKYSGMTPGEQVKERWYLNGKAVAEYPYAWNFKTDGTYGTYLPNKGDPLPDGEYYLEMYAGSNDALIGTSPKVTVGSGDGGTTPPPSTPAGDTVTIYGVITDADTGNPISGAYVFVLSSGMTYDKWQSENFADKYIVAQLKTDGSGAYKITDVPRNTSFTIVFAADSYNDKFGDNLKIGPDDPAQLELNVAMNK